MPIVSLKEADIHYFELKRSSDQLEGLAPLVMVHGLGANLAFWYNLASNFLPFVDRIILFDLRGHGRSSISQSGYTASSMATDLIQLMDYLDIAKSHLIGHSFGGSVVLHCACEYGHRVSSIVLADVRLRCLQPVQRLQDWYHWEKYRVALEAAGIVLDPADPESGYLLLQELAESQLRQPGQSAPMKDLLSPFSGKSGKRTAARWLKLLATSTAKEDFLQCEAFSIEQLAAISQPKLGVYGEYSQAVATARELKKLWSRMELSMIPKAGHFFPMSRPQEFIQATNNFLKQVKD
ncbi:MAG: alpha/beta hydrolase [Leptolyngbyaceae cyanobacterium MAG.088]|nr:alpha/beta hydrolase [Leptolyngbyaceae cyanobacterium MAG.088]